MTIIKHILTSCCPASSNTKAGSMLAEGQSCCLPASTSLAVYCAQRLKGGLLRRTDPNDARDVHASIRARRA